MFEDNRGGDDAMTADIHAERRRRSLLDLGEILHRARMTEGVSQEHVAIEAGLSAFTYNTLERGFSSGGVLANPTLDTILRVHYVLPLSGPLIIGAGNPGASMSLSQRGSSHRFRIA
jgi:transcriptional regulator with XRE-family HTH domain